MLRSACCSTLWLLAKLLGGLTNYRLIALRVTTLYWCFVSLLAVFVVLTQLYPVAMTVRAPTIPRFTPALVRRARSSARLGVSSSGSATGSRRDVAAPAMNGDRAPTSGRWSSPILAAAAAIAAAATAVALFRATAAAEAEGAPPAGRTHFLAIVGMAIAPLFLAIIVMNGVGVLVLSSCSQS